MAEEHLEVGTAGMMTTEEAGTAMKTVTTGGTIGRGALEMTTLGTTEVLRVSSSWSRELWSRGVGSKASQPCEGSGQ